MHIVQEPYDTVGRDQLNDFFQKIQLFNFSSILKKMEVQKIRFKNFEKNRNIKL